MNPPLSYISPKAAVKPSPIAGRGLFAVEPIRQGEIVCIKGGHIFDSKKLREISARLGPAEIQIEDDLFIGPVHEEEREGCMIFSNHSCAPNSRKVITGQDWRKKELQDKYRGFMSAYLQRKIDTS